MADDRLGNEYQRLNAGVVEVKRELKRFGSGGVERSDRAIENNSLRNLPAADVQRLRRARQYLDDGLYGEANKELQTLVGRNNEAIDHTQLMLGKFYYRLMDYDKALEVLGRLNSSPFEPLRHEAHMLQGVIFLNQGRNVDAYASFIEIPQGSELFLLAQYNMVLVQQGLDLDAGEQLLLKKIASQSRPSRPSDVHLIDKAKVNLAYSMIREIRKPKERKDPGVVNRMLVFSSLEGGDSKKSRQQYQELPPPTFQEARDILKTVSFKGVYSNKALLGLGWIAMELGETAEAGRLMSVLRERDPRDPYVQEAMVAAPYLMEKMNRLDIAVDQYRKAVNFFEAEQVQLEGKLRALDSGKLDRELLASLSISGNGRLNRNISAVRNENNSYLNELAATHMWRETIHNYLDLQQLSARVGSASQTGKVRRLMGEQLEFLRKLTAIEIQRKLDRVGGLLNQARYGLGELYGRTMDAEGKP